MRTRVHSATSFFGAIAMTLLITVDGFAVTTKWNVAGPADWNDPGNWDAGVPSAANPGGINNGGTAMISAPAPNVNDLGVGWPAGPANPTGFLNIVTGGSLTVNNTGDVSVGVKTSDNVSTLTVAGGSLTTIFGSGTGNLYIGNETGSKGQVILSSGTIAVANDLAVGYSGLATLVVSGSSGTITVGNFKVADVGGGSGTLDVRIDAGGISPITLNAGSVAIDNGAGSATLAVSLLALAPTTDLVLINNVGGGPVSGSLFAGLPDESPISASLGLTTYNWLLSYDYDAASSLDGSGNDIALKFVSVETVPEPSGFALAVSAAGIALLSRRRRDQK